MSRAGSSIRQHPAFAMGGSTPPGVRNGQPARLSELVFQRQQVRVCSYLEENLIRRHCAGDRSVSWLLVEKLRKSWMMWKTTVNIALISRSYQKLCRIYEHLSQRSPPTSYNSLVVARFLSWDSDFLGLSLKLIHWTLACQPIFPKE